MSPYNATASVESATAQTDRARNLRILCYIPAYNAAATIYTPPTRNWAFDSTFPDPNKLPPGTPQFQYIEPTAFRQVL